MLLWGHFFANGTNELSYAGSACFERNTSGTWTQIEKIVASDRQADDRFGTIAIDGNYAIVGAYIEDHDANGTNELSNAGAAYIFKGLNHQKIHYKYVFIINSIMEITITCYI